MGTRVAALVAAVCLPAVAAAQVETEEAQVPGALAEAARAAKPNVVWQNMVAARFNPLGLFNETRLGYRDWLYDDAEDRILQGCYAGASAVLFTSPALFQAGADLEYSPLAILQLHAGYRLVGYFGTFGMQQSYAGPFADWSDQQRRDQDALAQTSFGNMITGGALLQARFSNLVVRNNLRFFWQEQDLDAPPGGGTVNAFYDPVIDVLQPQGGVSIVNDADLLWLADEQWTLGIRHNFSQAFFDTSGLSAEQQELADASAFQQRIGPIIGYRLEPDPDRSAPAPQLFLLLQLHLTHRFRTGEQGGVFAPEAEQAVAQAVPYVGLAYRVAGDF